MIIIETPAPPTRERLVLVPVDACNEVREDDPRVKLGAKVGLTVFACHARDATPDDLGRAGWVTGEMLAEQVRIVWAAGQKAEPVSVPMLRKLKDRAEKAESDLAEVRELQRSDERDGNVGFSLTCWVESILEQLNVARINRTELGKAAGQYARERDEQRDRAARAERERDEALGRAQSETEWRVRAVSERQDAEAERDTLRAELARLTAPGEGSEGEPTDEELERAERAAEVFRAGVAHERARQQPAKDRATDEELFAAYQRAFVLASDREDGIEGDPDPERLKVEHVTDVERAAVRAVAARVWQERCLVAQAVAMGVSLEIGPHSKGVDIHVSRPRENADGGEFFEGELVEAGRDDVPPSEASATLARLLGEVSQ